MMGNWYRRFLLLRRVVLLYEYDDAEEMVPRQAMEVGGVRSCVAADGGPAFEVATPCGSRKWLCRAASAEDRDTWTAALDMAVAEEDGAADGSRAAPAERGTGSVAGGDPSASAGADPAQALASTRPSSRVDAARARIESLLRERIALRQAVSQGTKDADKARQEATQLRSELAAAQRELSSQKVTTMRAVREQRAREGEIRQLEQERCVPRFQRRDAASRRCASFYPRHIALWMQCSEAEARVNDAFGSFAAGGVARLKALAREEQERAAALARRLAEAEKEFEDILEFKVRRGGGTGRASGHLRQRCLLGPAGLYCSPRPRISTIATCARRWTACAPRWRARRPKASGSCSAATRRRIRSVCSWRRPSRRYWRCGAGWRRWRRRRRRQRPRQGPRPGDGDLRATLPAAAAETGPGPAPSPLGAAVAALRSPHRWRRRDRAAAWRRHLLLPLLPPRLAPSRWRLRPPTVPHSWLLPLLPRRRRRVGARARRQRHLPLTALLHSPQRATPLRPRPPAGARGTPAAAAWSERAGSGTGRDGRAGDEVGLLLLSRAARGPWLRRRCTGHWARPGMARLPTGQEGTGHRRPTGPRGFCATAAGWALPRTQSRPRGPSDAARSAWMRSWHSSRHRRSPAPRGTGLPAPPGHGHAAWRRRRASCSGER